jgi:purine-binding chemotaxis protein CheW
MSELSPEIVAERAAEGYVTARVDGQLFGLGLCEVRDVFVPKGICTVPLAPPAVLGLLNLRGRIVTAIDLRRRLGLSPRAEDAETIAIGIARQNELYALVADAIGDVLRLPVESYEPNPVNLDPHWADVCAGVHRLEQGTMMVLDVEGVFDFGRAKAAA